MTEVKAERPSWMPDKPYTYTRFVVELINVTSEVADDYKYVKPVVDGKQVDACMYWHPEHGDEPEGPGCVVGKILHRFGVPKEILIQCDSKDLASTSFGNVRHLFEGMFEPQVIAALDMLQTYQDSGTHWSMLYDLASVFRQGWNAHGTHVYSEIVAEKGKVES